MISKIYINKLEVFLKDFFIKNKEVKFFIFGSCLERKKFGDVDLGYMGKVKIRDVSELKEKLSDSTFPYFVDIVNFNKVSISFKKNVFNNKILWLKH